MTTPPPIPSTPPAAAAAATVAESTPVVTAPPKPKRPKKRSSTSNPETGSPSAVNAPPKPAPKRRKPSAAAATANAAAAAATTAPRLLPIPPPTNILIIDNGGDTVKYGWAASTTNSTSQPFLMTNVTARLQHQWTVLVGDEWEEYSQQHAASSAAVLSRSFERGIIVNLGHQVMVWKRILDVLGVSVVISNKNAETAQALGWKANTSSSSSNNKKTSQPPKQQSVVAATCCAVLLLLPPYCPRVIVDQMFHVWLEDFGVSHVGFALSSVCAAAIPHSLALSATPDTATGCVCLVDLGWSAVHIVPTYQGRLIAPATTTATGSKMSSSSPCIRRVPLGGRHLINLWKYITTYRQWNLMDQETLLRQVHHELAYVALNFASELQAARQRPAGQRPYDREVVLPDYQTTFACKVQIPRGLQRRRDEEAQQQKQQQTLSEGVASTAAAHDKSDEENEDSNAVKRTTNDNAEKEQDGENDKKVLGRTDQVAKKNKKKHKDDDEDDEDEDDDDDDEEETLEQKRKRLLRERQEEEERRRDQQQVLQVSVERFTIPEVLFRPSDAGLPESMAGVPQAIVQSIMACPRQYQAALFQSIHLVGGVAQLNNMSARLQKELRSLAPAQYQVKVTVSSQPVTQAWKGAQAFVLQAPFESWAWSKQDWLPHVASKKSSSHASSQAPISVAPSASSHGLYTKLMSKNPGMFV